MMTPYFYVLFCIIRGLCKQEIINIKSQLQYLLKQRIDHDPNYLSPVEVYCLWAQNYNFQCQPTKVKPQ